MTVYPVLTIIGNFEVPSKKVYKLCISQESSSTTCCLFLSLVLKLEAKEISISVQNFGFLDDLSQNS